MCGDLKYATNASGSWAIEGVDSVGCAGGSNALALDSNDKVHISYYDPANDDLKYVTNVSGSWVTEMVDNSGTVVYDASLALDSNDKVTSAIIMVTLCMPAPPASGPLRR